MRTRLTLCLLLLSITLPGSSAFAQVIPRSVEIGTLTSFYSFIDRGGFGQDKTVKLENIEDGLTLGARFGVNFTEIVGFETSFGILQGRTDDSSRRVWYGNLHLDGIFHLPFPYVVPYFAVGAGFQHYNIRPTYAAGEGPADFDRPYRDPYPDNARFLAEDGVYIPYRSADGDFLFNAGGGAKFLLYQNSDPRFGLMVGARLDIRYKLSVGPANPEDGVPTLETSGTDEDGFGIPASYNGLFHHIEVGGGIFVAFGGGIGPDRDKDGIGNRKDECPDDPEDKDAFEDLDGCPDLDNDADNVPDSRDDCPNEPEDFDGFEDEDGCPDLDNDQDGFVDSRDECPSQPEDIDGFEDRDGCPDLDNDQDGLLDTVDDCPAAAENFNSYLDDDGCPDSPPTALDGLIGQVDAVQFLRGSARLKRSTYRTLDAVIQAMEAYPGLLLQIDGHASSEGAAERNLRLSKERVLSVRDYLIDRGISPDRINATGYGEERLKYDESTNRGRRLNRRVEFTWTQVRD